MDMDDIYIEARSAILNSIYKNYAEVTILCSNVANTMHCGTIIVGVSRLISVDQQNRTS
jgi:hypothetical protein